MSVMSTLTDLSTVDPRTGVVVNQWDKPRNLNPPPPSNIDALYSNQPARDVDLPRLPSSTTQLTPLFPRLCRKPCTTATPFMTR
jgi:hypothetical protein